MSDRDSEPRDGLPAGIDPDIREQILELREALDDHE